MSNKIKTVNIVLQWILFVFLIVLDQVTKVLVRIYLPPEKNRFELIHGVFCLEHIENSGSVWGMLSGRISFLLIVSVILFAALLWIYIKMPKEKMYLPLFWIDIFMMAGAIGNSIDRIVFGHVTDFFYFELINFAIFNVADIYITCAAIVTIILMLTVYRDNDFAFLSFKKKPAEEPSESGESSNNN